MERAQAKGIGGAWWLVPALAFLLAIGGTFFAWEYFSRLRSAGEIGETAFISFFGAFFLIASVLVVSLVVFMSVFFRSRTVARNLVFENEMFRLIVEGVNDGIWDWDIAGKNITYSPRWLDMFGYQRGGLGGNPAEWLALIHPSDLPLIEQALKLHFEGKAPFFHAEYRIRAKSGEYKWALSRGRATFDGKKRPLRIAGSTTDISHLKEVEEVLKGQAELLERANVEIKKEKVKSDALLASIGDGLLATDKEGRIILMNAQAAAMLGKDIAECIGKQFVDVFPVEENEREEIIPIETRPTFRTLVEGKKITAVSYFIRPDGSKFPAAVTSSPIVLDGSILGAIVVFRDVTKEREIDKAKTEFVSLASHQLRTPLSAIRWYSEILVSEKLGSLNDDQRTYLKEVYQSNRRMIDLVNSLLNVSRIDLGSFAVEPKETDIIELCESVLMELSVKTVEKKQVIEKSYEKDFPKMNVDPKLMRIIFQNLLSNAVKYTPEDGRVTVSIAHSPENPEMMRIAVEDTGIGIPKDAQDRIFTKLFRADNARGMETEGTGLGLYIVKAIVEKAEGKVWFSAEEESAGGTTFFVELPLSGMKRVTGAKDLT